MWKPLLVALRPKTVSCENNSISTSIPAATHQYHSPISFLALLTDTPRLEADEKGIFFSQGQRGDLAQSFVVGGGLIRTFSTDSSNHTHSVWQPGQAPKGSRHVDTLPLCAWDSSGPGGHPSEDCRREHELGSELGPGRQRGLWQCRDWGPERSVRLVSSGGLKEASLLMKATMVSSRNNVKVGLEMRKHSDKPTDVRFIESLERLPYELTSGKVTTRASPERARLSSQAASARELG